MRFEISSNALPRTGPALVTFMATPGFDEEVKKSPLSIGPFSKETLTLTLPVKATAFGFKNVPSGPELSLIPGFSEITPKILC